MSELEILGGASHQRQAYLAFDAVLFCGSEFVLRNIKKLITQLRPEKITAAECWQELTVLKLGSWCGSFQFPKM